MVYNEILASVPTSLTIQWLQFRKNRPSEMCVPEGGFSGRNYRYNEIHRFKSKTVDLKVLFQVKWEALFLLTGQQHCFVVKRNTARHLTGGRSRVCQACAHIFLSLKQSITAALFVCNMMDKTHLQLIGLLAMTLFIPCERFALRR